MRKALKLFDVRLWPKKKFLLIGLALGFIFLNYYTQRPPPQINRQLDPSKKVDVLWVKKLTLLYQVPIGSHNTVYAGTIDDNIVAFNGVNGGVFWAKELPINERGIRDFLVNESAIFNVNTTEVYAYTTSFGDLIWETHLGDGHVGINSQLDDSLLRIYYGNKIFEISPDSGKILKEQNSGTTYWIEDDIEIHTISPNQNVGMRGINRITGETIWGNNNPVFPRDLGFPIRSVGNSIIVLTDSYGMCSLDIKTGRYIWCRSERCISNLGIEEEDKDEGYILRSDFMLVKLNLATGETLAEIQFLPKELPQEMRDTIYGYSVSVTKDVVIISFSDSDETFAIKNIP
jgi:outer membrane protein assembly factor BamB